MIALLILTTYFPLLERGARLNPALSPHVFQTTALSVLKGDFTNQNATQPETSPEVICSQSASLRMLGAKLQRVFFTFRTRGWHLQRFQKTWVVSTEFDLELNFLLLPCRQNCFSKSIKMLFIVKKYQTNILICLLLQVNWLPLWWMDNKQTRRVRYQSRKLARKSN